MLGEQGIGSRWGNSVCDLPYPVDNSQGCYVAQCDLQGGEQVGHQELLTLVRVVFALGRLFQSTCAEYLAVTVSGSQ